MSELSDLYQEIILDHNKRPRNSGVLDPCDRKAEGFNPLCGDKLTVYLRDGEESLNAVSCDCDGCAISRASGSIMTKMVMGKNRDEVVQLIAEVKKLLTGEEEPEADLMVQGELAALIGVRQFPARVKCATLAWHALEEALRGGEEASTEE